MLRVNNLVGLGGSVQGGVVPLTISAVHEAEVDGSNDPHNFTSVSFGATAAAGTRWIAVVVHQAHQESTLTSVTIGGTGATVLHTIAGLNGDSRVHICVAQVDSGTSGTVTVDTVGGGNTLAITVFRIIAGASADLTSTNDTGGDNTEVAKVLSDTMNCPAGGVILAGTATRNNDVSTMTWSGVTEHYDGEIESAADYYSSAADAFASQQSGLTVSATCLNTNQDNCLVIVSWGPNGAT